MLAEPPAPADVPAPDAPRTAPLTVLPISARSEEALVATAGRLAEHVGTHPDATLADLGYTLSQRRSHLNHRRALVADSIDDAREQLRPWPRTAGRSPRAARRPTAPKLAFVCTGMGPQWWRMCRGLLDEYPAFTDSIARTDRELSRYADWSLLDELRARRGRFPDGARPRSPNPPTSPSRLRWPSSCAVRHHPDAVIGHSAGEVAAHHLAGLLTFEQAVQVIYHRSRLQQRTSGRAACSPSASTPKR